MGVLLKSRALQSLKTSPVIGLLLLLCVALCVGSGCVRKSAVGLGPGDAAPGFSLKDLNGKQVKLSDYRGSVVLINFWATWCAPCIDEMPALERLYTRFKDRGLVVVSIGIDGTKDEFKKFKDEYKLTFPVLLDSSGGVKSKYRISGVPESFIVGRSGNFALLPDLEDDIPRVRIVGPREWDSPDAVSRISRLLEGRS